MGTLDLDCIMLGILSVGRLKVNLLALACGLDQAESPAGLSVLPLAMWWQNLGLGTARGKKWPSRWLPLSIPGLCGSTADGENKMADSVLPPPRKVGLIMILNLFLGRFSCLWWQKEEARERLEGMV